MQSTRAQFDVKVWVTQNLLTHFVQKPDRSTISREFRAVYLKHADREYETIFNLHNRALEQLVTINNSDGTTRQAGFDCYHLRILVNIIIPRELGCLPKQSLGNINIYRSNPCFSLGDFADLIQNSMHSWHCSVLNRGYVDPGLLFASCSPKIQFLSSLIDNLMVKKREKLLVLVSNLWQQSLLRLVSNKSSSSIHLEY
jgi:hypothetical protein